MSTLAADLRFACRSLLKARGFTATVVCTLGLGIALFLSASVVTRAYLLQDLPYPDAERLHWIRYDTPDMQMPQGMQHLDWPALADIIEHQVAWDLDVFYLLGPQGADAFPGGWVTPAFADAFGLSPTLGRGLAPQAFAAGGPNEALISHRLWQDRFGGTPDVIGRSFLAYVSDRAEETEHFTVVGVLPADFWHLNRYTDIVAPLRQPTFPYIARLREGVSPAQAAERVTALVAAGASNVPPGWSARVVAVHDAYVEGVRPTLRAVLLAGTLVLLVACANVAALLLVRASGRQREVAIRTALGAGRSAIARLLASEAAIIGVAASGLALWATWFALDAVSPLLQEQIGRQAPGGADAFTIDPRLIGFALGAGVATALACSLAPLLALVHPRVLGAGDGRSRTATEGRGAGQVRAALIALEIAASLALLAVASLMLRSAHELSQADLGFATERVLTGGTNLRQSRYPEPAARARAFEELRTRIAAVPGVAGAAFTTMWPMQQPQLRNVHDGGGREARAGVQAVSAGYFDVLGIPVRSGRGLVPADREGGEQVAVISEALARRLWRDSDPVGQSLTIRPAQEDEAPRQAVVVGVAADVRQGATDDNRADVYLPLLQGTGNFAFALARTSGPPERFESALRAVVRDVDPEISLASVVPMDVIARRTSAGSRFLAVLLTGFALAAAGLALVGVAGAVAYTVRQREREIAVRVAVGADPARIVRHFVVQGAGVLAVGVTLGTLGALAGGRAIQSHLYGVTPQDPLTLMAAAGAFGTAALLATWWPARRAAATDPAIALRDE